MQTTKSPWKVMYWACHVARQVLPDHASRFSRHDFTLAQLFACLVLRELLGLSYRGVEEVLRDTDWCARLQMSKVPDHTTLYRAFRSIITINHIDQMLQLVPPKLRRRMGKTLAIDSTLMETRKVSRHYERRCRDNAKNRAICTVLTPHTRPPNSPSAWTPRPI